MTITRANLEAILVRRAGKVMAIVGLDGASANGANADLNDPIGFALRKAGYGVTSIALVADADVASLSDDDVDLVLDLAELRLLKNLQSNMTNVDFTIGPHSESQSQIGARLEKRIDQLETSIAQDYGVGIGTLEGGTISLDFAEHGDDDE
jgi:hypothetical protein